ncbi:LysR family transcriptional regulator [Marinobacter salinisoli]|uniref:LysR family transcriptional regulator n=1 Tax=Marinobacter salinisoli TaxID=2769486 RepID=A0ABX7MTQ9_9GAMM|nr:LysR substrate-binding domain-containing protein [Marinobacter salinisoli]QSP95760.1 LysR family transcriptional regulator [Marinobacter salinisoli]
MPESMKHIPSTKALQAFITTARSLNITQAARSLNLTQGAISRQIASLEADLGITLFQRKARGLSMTPEAKLLLPDVMQAMDILHTAIDRITANQNSIRLKAPSCITYWLMPTLQDFQREHPEFDVELTSTTKHDVDFAIEPFDVAICYGNESLGEDGSYQWLFDEVLTPMCTADLAATLDMERPAESLSQHVLLHANAEQSDWQCWQSSLGLPPLRADRNQIFATLDMATNAALRGYGIVIGDVNLARHELDTDRLVAPFGHQVKSGKAYFLKRPSSHPSQGVETLSAFLASPPER